MGVSAWVFTAWLFGAGIAILPLVLGVAATIYLQVTSRMIEEYAVLQGFAEWCRKLGVRRGVRWLESERSVVPMTWGVWHPVVLVPSDWRRWSVDRTRLVVLHELAHVARLDVVYQALGRLVCSLFWFHPLVWYALKRLRVERELACDDCVVMAGELPSLYARQLVSIAREYQITVLPPAVAMAQRSGLENRVRSLLDQARSHSPLTQRVALVMVAVALLGVLGLAPIRFGTMAATMAQEKKVGSSLEGVSQGETDRSLIVQGTVVGPDGEPIDGAEVAVYRTYQANSTWLYEHELLAQGETSKSGSYRFEVPSKSKRFANRSHLEVQSIRVYATKEGLGPDERVVDASSPTQTLQLVSAKEVIQGRVVDLEGHPIAGVQVRVTSIDKPAVPIEAWVEHAKKNPATMPDDSGLSLSSNGLSKGLQVAFFPAKESILTMGPRGALEAKTGPDGTFVLKGIGDGRQATLALQSPNIATALLHCVTLDMEPVNMPLMDPRYRVGKTFGSRFEFPCEPTQWIQGTVRDRHSGQPIPGIHVSLGQFADHLLSIDGFLETITDAQGRYLLKGIPKAPNGSRGVRLRFYPGPEQPYFRAERTVPKSSTLEPIDFNLEMTQSVWIEGRLQDAQTKKPLRGVLAYYPRRTNLTPRITKRGTRDCIRWVTRTSNRPTIKVVFGFRRSRGLEWCGLWSKRIPNTNWYHHRNQADPCKSSTESTITSPCQGMP